MHPKWKWKGKKFKSKVYLEWVAKKFPGKILHHVFKLKWIDFFVVPVTYEEDQFIHHDANGGEEAAQKKYNRNYLWEIINLLISFLYENFREKLETKWKKK